MSNSVQRRRFKHCQRSTWEDVLRRVIAHNPLAAEFEWPGPEQVAALKRAGGNPYLHFWTQVDGNAGRFSFENWQHDWERVPPAFQDAERVFRTLKFTAGLAPSLAGRLASAMCREYGCSFYAHAVPSPAALQAIRELDMPVIELGSGRGYWAWLLERLGVRMVCEEIDEGYEWFWRSPERTTVRLLPRDHALLFCWPSYGERWAYNRLRRYVGNVVIYIGEHGGCTAEKFFHQHLETYFEPVAYVTIPQWEGLHDRLTIWRRR